jgi:hypothetical protein
MSKRTRYFMVGSALVLAVGLGTGLVAYYNGGLKGLIGSRAVPEELGYMPADAAAIAHADVAQIMNSEFRQRLKQILPSGEEKNALMTETGIDIEKDIDSVTAGFDASADGPKGAVVVVRGRFDAARIEALIRQHGGTVEEYQGKRLVTAGGLAGVDNATGCVAFLEPGVVALGDVATIKHAIDMKASGQNLTKNDAMMGFISEVEPNSNAWIVGRFDALQKATAMHNLPQQATDQLSMLQWFMVSARVDGGVSGVIRADARDDQSAENLRDVVRGGLAAGRLIAGKDVKVDALLNSIQMSGTGKTVALTFSVSPDVLDIINGIAGLKQHLTDMKPPSVK